MINDVEKIWGPPLCLAEKNEECLKKKYKGLVIYLFIRLVKANFEELCPRNLF